MSLNFDFLIGQAALHRVLLAGYAIAFPLRGFFPPSCDAPLENIDEFGFVLPKQSKYIQSMTKMQMRAHESQSAPFGGAL